MVNLHNLVGSFIQAHLPLGLNIGLSLKFLLLAIQEWPHSYDHPDLVMGTLRARNAAGWLQPHVTQS